MAEDKPTGTESEENAEPKHKDLRVQPEFWDNLFDAMPPWLDEISAIVLLVFGVISFMALLDVSSDATLSIAWSDALTSLFGSGSFIVAAGIFALGIIILLPKMGIIIRFSTRRILALEVAFLAALAILHLSAGDTELRALVRGGEGGGFIGWGVSAPLAWMIGQTVAVMVFWLVLFISLGVAIGLRRTQISAWLRTAIERLETYGNRLRTPAQPERAPQPPPLTPVEIEQQRRSPVVRIRPDMTTIPPSQRQTTPPPVVKEIPKDETVERLERAFTHAADIEQQEENPIQRDREEVIGTLVPKKNKSSPQMIQRPDGRLKRYFSVESMKEDRKVGRRPKDLPPLDLLQDLEINPPDEDEINHNVVLIENTLLEFDIDIDVVAVKVGPTVTQYAVQPYRESGGRTRLSKIASLANDLALSLSVKRLRLETPVPGESYMGIEVPNRKPSIVALRSVYESRAFFERSQKSNSPLMVPLGRDVSGSPVNVDIGGMPHLLIAGTTGSGKSVCIAAVATAVILNNTPDRVRMVMLDPKMVELSRFNGLPHLLGAVETDLDRIIEVLRWCTREMDRRYKLLEENAARNIEIYNTRLGQRRKSEHLPYIVIMVDEIGDLMMTKPEETERTITRLAQMARAVGMHLIVATQRPSVDVITGLIKANFPARISFAVASGVDSRVILDTIGAETLLGKGDMLYLAQDAAGPRRLQGCFVSDNEVRSIVDYWKNWHQEQVAAGKMPQRIVAPWERGLTRREFLAETDPMLEDAIEMVVNDQEASASQIQRKLGLGYPRAARIIDLLEELGVIGEPVAGGRSRKVLIEKGKDPFKEILDRRQKNKQ